MILMQRHLIRKNHPSFTTIDDMAFRSKNLYNASLYIVRQEFFDNGKYLNMNAVNALMKDNPDYKALPRKIGQQIQRSLEVSFKSFFTKNKNGDKEARPPKYLDKDGRYKIEFNKQAISFTKLASKGFVTLSGISGLEIKTDLTRDDIKSISITPSPKGYYINISYEVLEAQNDGTNVAAIDLGISNLATVTFAIGKPFIINGKPLKSINQYYNKEISSLKRVQKKRHHTSKYSKFMDSMTKNRYNKIQDYLHKASRILVNQLVSNKVSTLVIGYNKNWKQDINLGKVNNQKFVQIPHRRFVQLIEYKCKLAGISTIRINESYTSKCSFLDNESIKKHNKYKGSRVHRGLFKSAEGTTINADVNASYNIMRKHLNVVENSDVLSNDSIEVCSAPKIISVGFNNTVIF